MKQRNFETADLYLSSALSILLKMQPSYRVENGRTLFIFPISDEFYKAMADYNKGIPLNVFEYGQVLKRLRAEMLMRKGQR